MRNIRQQKSTTAYFASFCKIEIELFVLSDNPNPAMDNPIQTMCSTGPMDTHLHIWECIWKLRARGDIFYSPPQNPLSISDIPLKMIF